MKIEPPLYSKQYNTKLIPTAKTFKKIESEPLVIVMHFYFHMLNNISKGVATLYIKVNHYMCKQKLMQGIAIA